jgi:hypothetical protein
MVVESNRKVFFTNRTMKVAAGEGKVLI